MVRGAVRGDPLTLALEVGSPTLVTNGGSPLPIKGELILAASRLTIDGQLREPAALNGLALDVNLASHDPRGLLALSVSRGNALPPLAATGRLTREGEVFAVEGLRVSFGDSALDSPCELRRCGHAAAGHGGPPCVQARSRAVAEPTWAERGHAQRAFHGRQSARAAGGLRR